MFSAAKSGTVASTGYNLTNSLRFRASASASLSRTPGVSPTSNKIMTLSMWVKRGALGSPQQSLMGSPNTGNADNFRFSTSDTLSMDFQDGAVGILTTTQVFRDPSAWYHIVLAIDTTQATASNRAKIYINGSEVTAFGTASYPAQNTVVTFSSTNATYLGRYGNAAQNYFDGYMDEVNFIDGQALTPSSFGSTNATTGVWQPARYTGTYGTNGFYLNFSDIALTSGSNAGLGKDNSGNGNYFNTSNISVTAGTTYDAMSDVPTLTSATVANYCVLNNINTLTTATLSNANIAFTTATTGHNAIGSIGMSVEKYYWEAQTSAGTTQARATVYGTSASTYYSFAANNTVYGFRFDATAGTLDYTTNGSSFTSLATGLTSGPYFPYFNNNGTTSKTISVNFGQRPFTYTPPTGYKALNTFNLPDSTVVKGNTVMDATLYTGNLTGQSITNAAPFKPDLVWIKSRSAATDNKLTDSVRGTTKALISNTTGAETTDVTGMTAFNSNGFTVGASTDYNNTSATYVGWQWQAGQGSSSSNTSGSITSTVSVNATAGFSVVTYTGTGANATVGHGLGVAPKMVIVKKRSATGSWAVYHIGLTSATFQVWLDLTSNQISRPGTWNSTAPTSTVFSIGTDTDVNVNAATFVAYCWAEIAGFSKFGSYTGNSSANGPFVYLGFRPKFIIVKRFSSTGNWEIVDSSRSTYNEATAGLRTESAGAESSLGPFDLLSNGFKLRGINGSVNDAGTYLYIAFAENPFKNANAR
jgi:hypothetical protein